MGADRFDTLLAALTTAPSRRGALRLLGGLGLAGLFGQTDAKKKNKKKCAKAGQPTSKKRKKCCSGLVKDETGRCAASPLASPPLPCGQSCPGCCDGERCQSGTSAAACGASGIPCGVCSGLQRTCFNGACHCDVCPSGCRYASVQAAVADPSGPSTITVCAGIYLENVTIDRNVSLMGAGDGNGTGNTILAGTSSGSAVTVNVGRTVTLERLSITGGVAPNNGGGIIMHRDATVTVRQCTITGNSAGFAGGGIYNLGGTLTLDASNVTNNGAAAFCGGICNIETSDGGSGVMMLQNGSTVIGNTAPQGGGILNSFNCLFTLASGSSVSQNTADIGGGIFNHGALTLIASAVMDNTASDFGGGIYNNGPGTANLFNRSSITGNTANAPAPSGGGIFNSHGVVNPVGGSITGNTPDNCANVGTGFGCPP